MKNIQPIVEGHGEVEAVPVLLRRLTAEAKSWEITVGRPIRRYRSQLVEKSEKENPCRFSLAKSATF